MSTLYRTFKTFLYRAIPNSYKSTNPNEFVLSQDLVTVFKVTDQDQVYENRNVSLNQLAGMIGGGSQGVVGPQGPQGPAGPAVPSGLNWLGEYNSGTAYELNDVVTWTNPDTDILGSYWVTNEAGISGVAPTNNSGVINAGWAFLASQGAQGLQGIKGEQGPVGPQGPAGPGINFKEINFSVQTYADGSGLNPNIEIGYSTFSGGLTATSNEGWIYIYFTNENDYISSGSKCIITTQTPISYGNQFNFIISSQVRSPNLLSDGIDIRVLTQNFGQNQSFISATRTTFKYYVNIKVYN